jgi:vacuolar-type H+-ATPase subunit H
MVRYGEVIAICIEALKEQDTIINQLEERAEKLFDRAKEKGLLI